MAVSLRAERLVSMRFEKIMILFFGLFLGFLFYPLLITPFPKVSHYSAKVANLFEPLLLRDPRPRPRILCFVLTSPANHQKKAVHVGATWGKRCDRLLLMTTGGKPELEGAVLLNVSEGRKELWAKTKAAFTYVYAHHLEEADWFVKADDDTYIVVENLRRMLAEYDSNKLIHFGHRFKALGGYFAGGAGYVLSRAAVKRLVEVGDSRDNEGRKRFFPFEPQHHLIPQNGKKDWAYDVYTAYPELNGTSCCSDTAISFHYVQDEKQQKNENDPPQPPLMYVMEYLIYHLRAVEAEKTDDTELVAKVLP